MRRGIRKNWKSGRLKILFVWNRDEGLCRFGGGWNWQVGVQCGGRSVIFNLLFCYLRITLARRQVVGT